MDLTKILEINDVVYSPLGGNGVVVSINFTTSSPIRIQWENGNWSTFTKDGKFFTDSPECLLFPSKENRDWDTFKREKEIPFKPFDKVLARDGEGFRWYCEIFSHYEPNAPRPFVTIGYSYQQCIPYNSETQHLLRSTEACLSKYKIWE